MLIKDSQKKLYDTAKKLNRKTIMSFIGEFVSNYFLQTTTFFVHYLQVPFNKNLKIYISIKKKCLSIKTEILSVLYKL